MSQEQRRRHGPGGDDDPSRAGRGGTATKVRMGVFPGGELKDYEFEANVALEDALGVAELLHIANGREVRVNGKIEKDLSRKLSTGDQVHILGKVRGN